VYLLLRPADDQLIASRSKIRNDEVAQFLNRYCGNSPIISPEMNLA